MKKIFRHTLGHVVLLFALSSLSYAGMGGEYMSGGYSSGDMTISSSTTMTGPQKKISKKMARKWKRMSHSKKMLLMDQMLQDPDMRYEIMNRLEFDNPMNQLLEQMAIYLIVMRSRWRQWR